MMLLSGCVTQKSVLINWDNVLPEALLISEKAVSDRFAFLALESYTRSYEIQGDRLAVTYNRQNVRPPTMDEPFTRFVSESIVVLMTETNVLSVTIHEQETNRIPPSRNNI